MFEKNIEKQGSEAEKSRINSTLFLVAKIIKWFDWTKHQQECVFEKEKRKESESCSKNRGYPQRKLSIFSTCEKMLIWNLETTQPKSENDEKTNERRKETETHANTDQNEKEKVCSDQRRILCSI